MRATADTIAAADALCMVWCFANGNIHFAYLRTDAAAGAFLFVNAEAVKRQFIAQRIECAKRTKPFTKGTVKKYR